MYAYVGNNPLGFVDPFGFDKKKKGCAAGGQSTTVTNISIGYDDKGNGPNLNVDLQTEGFLPDSKVSVDVRDGSLRSDLNPAGTNRVNFGFYGSGTGKVGKDNTATATIPLSNLYPGQYLQIIPQRLKDPYAPVITPDVGKQGEVRPNKKVDSQSNYDSTCQ